MSTLTRRTVNPMAEMLDWIESFGPVNVHGLGLAPYVRIEDFLEDGTYVVRAELPGIDPAKDVEVTVDHDLLTIKGERREETKEKNRREFPYGSCSRTISLPGGAKADEVAATYTDGVLEVRVPTGGEAPSSVHVPIQHKE